MIKKKKKKKEILIDEIEILYKRSLAHFKTKK